MPSLLSRFALAFVVLAGVARADEDVYYRLRLDDVKFVDGARPQSPHLDVGEELRFQFTENDGHVSTLLSANCP
jgi:hypothetical protein